METAKNLALQGVGAITLVDQAPTVITDTGLNFFLTPEEAEAGMARAEAVAPKLRELNPMCTVQIAHSLTDELILAHTALVITDTSVPLATLLKLNDVCHSVGVSFFYSFSGGACASLFVDHGENHKVHDPNGEKPIQKLITSITRLEEASSSASFLVRYEDPEGQVRSILSLCLHSTHNQSTNHSTTQILMQKNYPNSHRQLVS